MKRDLDLIRDILLHIEKMDDGGSGWVDEWGDLSDVDDKTRIDHVKMLWEVGYIDATDASSMSGTHYIPRRITMAGHDYLDSVRDPKIWRDTKSGLKKVGGGASLAIIQALANGLINKALGI